jgi:hypothetical protein
MIIKRAIAVESLTKVCEESLNLIKQLIDADNDVYAKGFEDGMAAQSEVQKTLRPWVDLTNDELTDLFYNTNLGQQSAVGQAIALLKERNS